MQFLSERQLKKRNAEITKQLQILASVAGGYQEFSDAIKMPISTLYRRRKDPGTLTIDELTTMSLFAANHKIPFEPLREVLP